MQGSEGKLIEVKSIWKENDLVVFLGAGASCDSGLPLGDEAAARFVKGIFADLDAKCPDDEPSQKWPRFEVVVDILEQYIPKSAVGLVKTFEGIGLGATHQLLAELSRPGWLWLTTNFDDQLERAHKEPPVIIRDRTAIGEAASFQKASSVLIKLHGDGEVKDPTAGLGAGIRQVLRAFPPKEIESISALAKGRPLVFIGYSARDPDLLPLIRSIVAGASRVAWIDVPEWSKLPEDKRRHFESILGPDARQRYIPGGAQNILEQELDRRVQPLRSTKWGDAIAQWIGAQPRPDLALALADICLSAAKPHLVPDVLAIVPASDGRWVAKLDIQARYLAQIGEAYKVGGLADECLTELDHLPEQDRQYATRVIGLAYHAAGRYQTALNLLRSSVDKATPRPSPNLIEAVSALGATQVYVGGDELDQGLGTLRDAAKLAADYGDRVLESQVRKRLALGLLRAGNADDALCELDAVDNIEAAIGDEHRILGAMLNRGEALRKMGKVEEALKINEQIITRAGKIPDHDLKVKATINKTLCQIEFEDDPLLTADVTLCEALAILKLRRNPEILSTALATRGYLRFCCALWDESIEFLTEATDAFLDCGAKERAGYTLVLAGWAQLRSGSREKARESYNRILREGLVPRMEFPADFEMLTYALDCTSGLGPDKLEEVETKFKDSPLQRFQLLLLMLESSAGVYDPSEMQEVVGAARRAARESGGKVLQRVLQSSLKASGLDAR